MRSAPFSLAPVANPRQRRCPPPPPVLVNIDYSRERATPSRVTKRRRHSGSDTTSVMCIRCVTPCGCVVYCRAGRDGESHRCVDKADVAGLGGLRLPGRNRDLVQEPHPDRLLYDRRACCGSRLCTQDLANGSAGRQWGVTFCERGGGTPQKLSQSRYSRTEPADASSPVVHRSHETKQAGETGRARAERCGRHVAGPGAPSCRTPRPGRPPRAVRATGGAAVPHQAGRRPLHRAGGAVRDGDDGATSTTSSARSPTASPRNWATPGPGSHWRSWSASATNSPCTRPTSTASPGSCATPSAPSRPAARPGAAGASTATAPDLPARCGSWHPGKPERLGKPKATLGKPGLAQGVRLRHGGGHGLEDGALHGVRPCGLAVPRTADEVAGLGALELVRRAAPRARLRERHRRRGGIHGRVLRDRLGGGTPRRRARR